MKTQDKLKLCPFCGRTPELIEIEDAWAYYSCDCGADAGIQTENELDARHVWNSRPEEERLQKRVAELEKALRDIFERRRPSNEREAYVFVEAAKAIAQDALRGADNE